MKLFSILVMVLLVAAVAVHAERERSEQGQNESGKDVKTDVSGEDVRNDSQDMERNASDKGLEERNEYARNETEEKEYETDNGEHDERSDVHGLENAILHVRNNETKAHLEDVLQKIADQRKAQLAKLENLTVDKDDANVTHITGKGKAKFLGLFTVEKTYDYDVDSTGNVEKHGHFSDFLFAKEDPIDS